MRTLGFLVAVETEAQVPSELIEAALCFYFEEHPKLRDARVDAEALGEIDVYPDEEKNG